MDERPEELYSQQPELAGEAPAPAEKKSRKGLILGLAIGVTLAVAALIFLLFYCSADARFDRAMQALAFDQAEQILRSEKLKASERNDSHYLRLAEQYLTDYRSGASDCRTAVERLLALEAADFYVENTRESIEADRKTVLELYIAEISENYRSKKTDYPAAMQEILALRAEDFLDNETRKALDACEEAVVEARLGEICRDYENGRLDYDSAFAQIGQSNPYGEAAVASLVAKYLTQIGETRDTFYADAIGMITDAQTDHAPEDIVAALSSFGDYRSAEDLAGIYDEIKDGNGVEAAKFLLAYRDRAEDADDPSDAASSPEVFAAVRQRILDIYLEADTAWDDYAGKLDLRLRSDYVDMLFGDTPSKITTLFGSESIRALKLGKTFDLDWFSGCSGGTGKILYIAHYLNSSSGDTYDEYYYYRYENLKDIPLSQMPESLEEVEYLVLYDQGGKFYDNYYGSGGSKVAVYIRTIQVTVIHFPTGEVIYDSGLLTGPAPGSTITLFSGTEYAYGDDPDLTDVLASVRALVGLE